MVTRAGGRAHHRNRFRSLARGGFVLDGAAASLLSAADRENDLEFGRVQLATATDGTGSKDCSGRGADCPVAPVKAAGGL